MSLSSVLEGEFNLFLKKETILPVQRDLTAHSPEILHADKRGGIIFLCDHASNFIPKALEGLGIDARFLEEHIAYDLGTKALAHLISSMMQMPAVLAPVSRLVIDCNRDLKSAGLVPVQSDGVRIIGNCGLDDAAIEARIKAYYDPFHQAIEGLIDAHLESGVIPLIVGLHSFTPRLGLHDLPPERQQTARPWHIGLLWDQDPRLAQGLIGIFERETDLIIGDNQPYSGKDLYYSMERHGARRGLPQTTIEIRQDLLKNASEQEQWAVLLANSLDECLAREDIRSVQFYSR